MRLSLPGDGSEEATANNELFLHGDQKTGEVNKQHDSKHVGMTSERTILQMFSADIGDDKHNACEIVSSPQKQVRVQLLYFVKSMLVWKVPVGPCTLWTCVFSSTPPHPGYIVPPPAFKGED